MRYINLRLTYLLTYLLTGNEAAHTGKSVTENNISSCKVIVLSSTKKVPARMHNVMPYQERTVSRTDIPCTDQSGLNS